jgi:hypothetical protein
MQLRMGGLKILDFGMVTLGLWCLGAPENLRRRDRRRLFRVECPA